jgi:beta-phosphoglucomutase-like phosphatase (HAD superfamily)
MSHAILDVDGTLVDTNYQHALAWYRAFSEAELKNAGAVAVFESVAELREALAETALA